LWPKPRKAPRTVHVSEKRTIPANSPPARPKRRASGQRRSRAIIGKALVAGTAARGQAWGAKGRDVKGLTRLDQDRNGPRQRQYPRRQNAAVTAEANSPTARHPADTVGSSAKPKTCPRPVYHQTCQNPDDVFAPAEGPARRFLQRLQGHRRSGLAAISCLTNKTACARIQKVFRAR